jgi:type II secretory pathway pseudopilin PulG
LKRDQQITRKSVRCDERPSHERGFTILETTIALLLMAIVGLGAAQLFFYSVKQTETAGDRELAMAVAQQAMEQFRNVDFGSTTLTATAGTTTTITRAGRTYTVVTTIVNSNVVNGAATTKTITVRVSPNSDFSAWARTITSVFGSVTLVSQRSAMTLGPNRLL